MLVQEKYKKQKSLEEYKDGRTDGRTDGHTHTHTHTHTEYVILIAFPLQ
jgi:hypothetical protein